MCILLVFTETFLLARILYINPLQFQSYFFDRRAELTPRALLPRAQVWGFVKGDQQLYLGRHAVDADCCYAIRAPTQVPPMGNFIYFL